MTYSITAERASASCGTDRLFDEHAWALEEEEEEERCLTGSGGLH